jgi:hypothetical protein
VTDAAAQMRLAAARRSSHILPANSS